MKHALDRHTYQVNYNPNCPSPFEVVTCGGAGLINRSDKRCFRSFGKTLDEARDAAFQKVSDHERDRRVRYEQAPFAGIVWA